ncbi:hypothetical protein CC80DRAFT_99020 [Byssothecium circinans]|uniref:Large ribosomal subunit protein bL28m n=1 Tax=Byssothecium circinans TaxID=147558 RepID=A0A6A5UGG1_9PLEO|nr:hypothetical protein CC80DRAFT_99020 [Byssothecium circinans]
MPPRCQLLFGNLYTPRTVFLNPNSTQRGFSSSSTLCKNPLARRKGGDLGKHLPKYVIPQDADMPEYPYGMNRLFKQADKGLYGGQMIQFGNNVSKKTETKTRCYWKPNVLYKSLYSVALKKRIHLRITAKVLKTIDNEGGLDEYLLKPSEARIKELGPLGWALRWTLLQKPQVVWRMRADAQRLGLTKEQIDKQWPMPHPVVLAETEKAEAEALKEAAAKARTQPTPATIAARARDKKRVEIATAAAIEYEDVMAAAKRYRQQALVDTKEEGMILALIKEKVQTKRYHQLFEDEDKKEQGARDVTTPVRQALPVAGEAAGDRETFVAQTKAEYAQSIADAKNAQSDPTVSEADRLYYQLALEKFQQMIEAESMEDYVEVVTEAEMDRLPTTEVEATAETTTEQDAWGALVDSTKPRSQTELRR